MSQSSVLKKSHYFEQRKKFLIQFFLENLHHWLDFKELPGPAPDVMALLARGNRSNYLLYLSCLARAPAKTYNIR